MGGRSLLKQTLVFLFIAVPVYFYGAVVSSANNYNGLVGGFLGVLILVLLILLYKRINKEIIRKPFVTFWDKVKAKIDDSWIFKTDVPWISIWVNPRKTIRKIVSENPKYMVWHWIGLYSILYSSGILIFRAYSTIGLELYSSYPKLSSSILSTVGDFLYVFLIWFSTGYFILPFLLNLVGKVFGGKGNFENTRTVIAWSYFCMAVNATFYLIPYILTALPFFSKFFSLLGLVMALIAFIVMIIAGLTAIRINLVGLSEVHDYSIGKSILTYLLSAGAIAIFMQAIGLSNLMTIP